MTVNASPMPNVISSSYFYQFIATEIVADYMRSSLVLPFVILIIKPVRQCTSCHKAISTFFPCREHGSYET